MVIGYELGPTADYSEGHILTATAKPIATGATSLSLTVEPETATVSIDGIEVIGAFVSDLDLSSQHTVRAEATGYEPIEFTILPDNQSDRDKLTNFDLQLDINLMLIPLEIGVK